MKQIYINSSGLIRNKTQGDDAKLIIVHDNGKFYYGYEVTIKGESKIGGFPRWKHFKDTVTAWIETESDVYLDGKKIH